MVEYNPPVYYCGTIMSNHVEIPDKLRDPNAIKGLKRGESISMRKKDKEVGACVWMDKKPIHTISTAYPVLGSGTTSVGRKDKTGEKVQYSCPPCVKAYNMGMGGELTWQTS